MKRSSMKKWLAICIAGMLAIPAVIRPLMRQNRDRKQEPVQ